jgi:hypothetical protein
MPASDEKTSLIQSKYIARCYTIIDGAVTEVGSGIIDKIEYKVTNRGELLLVVSGDDLGRELTYRQVGDLLIDDGAGNPDDTGPADIIALAPSGWSLDTTTGFNSTIKGIYHQYEGESVLAAFVRLAELTGEHFYITSDRKVVWMRATGSAKLTHSGITGGPHIEGETVTGGTSGATGALWEATGGAGAGYLYVEDVSGSFVVGETVTGGSSGATCTTTAVVNPSSGIRAIQGGDPVALADNTGVCLVQRLQELEDSYDLVTRVYPYGAGEGDARTTLSGSTWSKSGWTIDTTNNYIRRDAAESAFGRIERYISWKDIEDADSLAEMTYEYLMQHSYAYKAYKLQIAKLDDVLTVGKRLHTIYHRWIDGFHAVNIDDEELVILEAKTRIDGKGLRTVGLQIATAPRYPETDEGLAVATMGRQSQNFYTHSQPISGSSVGSHSHTLSDITDSPDFDISARAYNSSNFTHNSTGNWLSITLDSERWDTDTIHSTVSNTGRLTCKTAGKYLIIGQASFAANATGRRRLQIVLNGTTTIGYVVVDNLGASTVVRFEVVTVYNLSVNDYVQLQAWQNSGGNLDINAAANYSPEFMMAKVP